MAYSVSLAQNPHRNYKGKYDVTVLHDDAVVINVQKYAIALEPAYFDKMGLPDELRRQFC